MRTSQASRILSVLWDGKEHTSAEIQRKAGRCVIHSRISDLRKKGCVIECRRKPHRNGQSAYAYQLVAFPAEMKPPPEQTEWERLTREAEERREAIPRDLEHRYRLYAVRKGGVLDLLGATATAGEIGEMIVSMGRDGLLTELCIGLLDTYGTETSAGSWLVNPWDQ